MSSTTNALPIQCDKVTASNGIVMTATQAATRSLNMIGNVATNATSSSTSIQTSNGLSMPVTFSVSQPPPLCVQTSKLLPNNINNNTSNTNNNNRHMNHANNLNNTNLVKTMCQQTVASLATPPLSTISSPSSTTILSANPQAAICVINPMNTIVSQKGKNSLAPSNCLSFDSIKTIDKSRLTTHTNANYCKSVKAIAPMKNAQDSNQSTDLIVTDTVPAKPSSATDLVQNKTNGELVVDGKNKQQLTQVRLLYAYFLEV